MDRKKYHAGPTTIRFLDTIEIGKGKPTRELDVGVPVDLVVDAVWVGEDIRIALGSSAKDTQSELMYEWFFEEYSVDFLFARKHALDGFEQAMWQYELDEALIGEDDAINKIKEIVTKHNEEILRIRKSHMEKKSESDEGKKKGKDKLMRDLIARLQRVTRTDEMTKEDADSILMGAITLNLRFVKNMLDLKELDTSQKDVKEVLMERINHIFDEIED